MLNRYLLFFEHLPTLLFRVIRTVGLSTRIGCEERNNKHESNCEQ